MTDNTQELRKRLFKQEPPGGWYYFIDADNVPQAGIHREAVDKMMEVITDWHNKQVEQAYSDGFKKASKGAFKSQQAAKREAVEAVLDRLEARLTEDASGIRQIKTDYAYGFTAANDQTNEAIEAERKRLKESR